MTIKRGEERGTKGQKVGGISTKRKWGGLLGCLNLKSKVRKKFWIFLYF